MCEAHGVVRGEGTSVETQASAAVEELHRLHSKNVHRYVYGRLLDIEASRQIANDAFRLAWQRGISPGADALPWLLVAARNLVGNELHSMGREKNLVFKAAAAQLSERGGRDSGLDDQVHEVLDALRAKDREVLILAYWDALSIAEIAAVLECSHESAKSRLFRARNAVDRKAPTSMLKGGGSNGQHSEAHFRHRSGRTRQHRRSRSAATPRPRPGLQPAAGTGQSGKFPGQMADPRGRNSHRRSGRRTRYLGSMAGPDGNRPGRAHASDHGKSHHRSLAQLIRGWIGAAAHRLRAAQLPGPGQPGRLLRGLALLQHP
ncbi:hypothetical protein DQ353_00060 [Arthrobacter sp. AQ5-05]|nr:hypothetical protein DQ353_00060 [Arthrobacter sp. AQ5-05]